MSDSWPHVGLLYEEAGFDPSGGQVEIVYAGTMDSIPEPEEGTVPGLGVQRRLGALGTAFDAVLHGEGVGTYEADDDLKRGGSNLAFTGWADECDHWVQEDLRGQGIGSWLLAHAGAWLRLGGTTRLIAYAIENDHIDRCTRYHARHGLQPINRTVRGWRCERRT